MRRVRTVVLPVPAPATMRSGPSPWVTAAAWAGFSPLRIRCAPGCGGSAATTAGRGPSSGRDTPDLSLAGRPRQGRASTQNFGYQSPDCSSEVTVTNPAQEGPVTRASLREYAGVQRERYRQA